MKTEKGDSPEPTGWLLETSGNGRPRGMNATAGGATCPRNTTRLTNDVDRAAHFAKAGWAVRFSRRAVPERMLTVSGPDHLCPQCGCLLGPQRAGRFRLDACEDCGGVWVSNEQIQKMVVSKSTRLLDLARTAAAKATEKNPTPRADRRCPDCDKPLKPKTIEGLDVDMCKRHGTWFDAEELVRYADPRAPAKATAAGDSPVIEVVGGVLQVLGGILEVLAAF